VTVDYGGHLLLSPLLRTATRWAPKWQIHQKAYELWAPVMGIYFGAVTTTGATNVNQLQLIRSDKAAFPVDVGAV
jgi:hypothetical protein